MKIGFVSDVHANLEAFQTVLAHMNEQDVDIKACLGDLVGYGPNPNECVDLAVANFNYIVMGNHDEASIDLEKSWGFNPVAKEATEWTAKQLSTSSKEYIKNLEYGYTTDEGLLFVHGSPNEPFDYIISDREASTAFATAIADFQIAFVGHTHVPALWLHQGKVNLQPIRYDKPDGELGLCQYIIPEDTRAIVNVGAVGQPRDGDTRASYVIYDTESRLVSFIRVPYPKHQTISKIKITGLPYRLWQRLMYGE